MWKKVLREYFAFPKKERRAIWVLFIIWLCLLLVQFVQHRYFDFKHLASYKINVNTELNKEDLKKLNKQYKKQASKSSYSKKYYFNYITFDELTLIGISKSDAKKIINQKEKGLKIYTADDLKKITDVDTFSVSKLKSFLKFFPSKKYFAKTKTEFKNNIVNLVNINNADSIMLDGIKGIGMGTAKRVIAYRDKLGGYVNIEQLKEVWGIDSALFTTLKKSVYIETNSHQKININTVDFERLSKHPYIGYKLAKIILNYRMQHGNFTSTKDLLNIHVMNENIFSKIEMYISIYDDR